MSKKSRRERNANPEQAKRNALAQVNKEHGAIVVLLAFSIAWLLFGVYALYYGWTNGPTGAVAMRAGAFIVVLGLVMGGRGLYLVQKQKKAVQAINAEYEKALVEPSKVKGQKKADKGRK